MGEIQILDNYDFGQSSFIPETDWSAELTNLETLGLAQLKHCLITLLKNDRDVRRAISNIALKNPYLVKEYDGGYDDVDFL